MGFESQRHDGMWGLPMGLSQRARAERSALGTRHLPSHCRWWFRVLSLSSTRCLLGSLSAVLPQPDGPLSPRRVRAGQPLAGDAQPARVPSQPLASPGAPIPCWVLGSAVSPGAPVRRAAALGAHAPPLRQELLRLLPLMGLPTELSLALLAGTQDERRVALAFLARGAGSSDRTVAEANYWLAWLLMGIGREALAAEEATRLRDTHGDQRVCASHLPSLGNCRRTDATVTRLLAGLDAPLWLSARVLSTDDDGVRYELVLSHEGSERLLLQAYPTDRGTGWWPARNRGSYISMCTPRAPNRCRCGPSCSPPSMGALRRLQRTIAEGRWCTPGAIPRDRCGTNRRLPSQYSRPSSPSSRALRWERPNTPWPSPTSNGASGTRPKPRLSWRRPTFPPSPRRGCRSGWTGPCWMNPAPSSRCHPSTRRGRPDPPRTRSLDAFSPPPPRDTPIHTPRGSCGSAHASACPHRLDQRPSEATPLDTQRTPNFIHLRGILFNLVLPGLVVAIQIWLWVQVELGGRELDEFPWSPGLRCRNSSRQWYRSSRSSRGSPRMQRAA